MIWATRLDGSEILINADLIETIEATPDTVVTLIDGTRFIITESPDDCVNRIQHFRSALLRMRDNPDITPGHRATVTHIDPVPDGRPDTKESG